MGSSRRQPEIVLRNGKPKAVILSLEDYEQLLERAEDVADLRALKAMRRRPSHFRRLSEVLNGPKRRV